jgi:5-methylcytosine-specific restriction protein A
VKYTRPSRARSKKPTDPFYRTQLWKQTRAQALALYGRVCASCRRPIAEDERAHVDHVRPRSEAPQLALSLENLRVLCHGCHSRKTTRHDGGFGNAPRAPGLGTDVSGQPTSSAHPWNNAAVARGKR